jgi:hypothetical protein
MRSEALRLITFHDAPVMTGALISDLKMSGGGLLLIW